MLIEKNPESFEKLKGFYDNHSGLFESVKIFSELLPQFVFYINYIDFMNLQKSNGFNVCEPIFDDTVFSAYDCGSVSLAVKFFYESLNVKEIVRNNINLPKGGKFILSGPNQGGKTIYLKQLGLTAYLAKCGCFVLCESCRVPFYDKILTHFMQKEVLGKSRLVEEIERIEEKIMPEITSDSLVLLNESFTSTRRKDSVEISLHYLRAFDDLKCSVGFVSHFYELPELHKNLISLRSGIGESGARTYHITEQKGDGLAYALDISRACGTTYEQLSKSLREYRVNY
jgi:DNA mismatch repair ATPase MutS